MLFAICTNCAFLRAFSTHAAAAHAPEHCPACGGEIETHGTVGRFQPTYVGKVSLDLHMMPPLERGSGNPTVPPS